MSDSVKVASTVEGPPVDQIDEANGNSSALAGVSRGVSSLAEGLMAGIARLVDKELHQFHANCRVGKNSLINAGMRSEFDEAMVTVACDRLMLAREFLAEKFGLDHLVDQIDEVVEERCQEVYDSIPWTEMPRADAISACMRFAFDEVNLDSARITRDAGFVNEKDVIGSQALGMREEIGALIWMHGRRETSADKPDPFAGKHARLIKRVLELAAEAAKAKFMARLVADEG